MKNIIQLILFLTLLGGCQNSKSPELQEDIIKIDSIQKPAAPNAEPLAVYEPVCNLTIRPVSSTLQKYYIFQAKNFAATDISCWSSIKDHGIAFCQNKFPCRVIYIENDKLGPYKKDPLYPDFDVLKKYGVGEFTKFKEGYGWQLAGADAMSWGRNQQGYDYFID
ncbi:MAG: hypothetical protein ABIQ11_09990 [Saprospiraceae bacterium]